MDFAVEIQGLDRIDRAADRVKAQVASELLKAMYASVTKVEGEAKKSILSGSKSGRTYKRRTVVHRASAPGEAPASDTGRLVNSFHATVDRTGVFVGTVAVEAQYANALEFGTAKMAARPFLFPALEKSKAWIAERMNKAVRIAAANSAKK